jgi:dienelactone hydrolase
MQNLPIFFRFFDDELYFFDGVSKKVYKIDNRDETCVSKSLKSADHPIFYHGCPYAVLHHEVIAQPPLISLKRVVDKVYGMDLHRVYEINGTQNKILFETDEMILDFLKDSSSDGLIIHTTRKGVSPYRATDLWWVEKRNEAPVSLNNSDAVVTHFAFDPGTEPYFLTDTDPHFESSGIDLYKKRAIGCSNIVMFVDRHFLLATKEGVDVLIERKGAAWIEHPLGFTSIQELFCDENHLYIAGFAVSGPLKILKARVEADQPIKFDIFLDSFMGDKGVDDLLPSLQLRPFEPKAGKGWIVGQLQLDRPTIIRIHGGPIAHVEKRVTDEILAYHAKGYNLIYPNYRGSTGYGRKHRIDLLGHYSEADVTDILNLIGYLIEKGVDPKNIILKGKSSAGLTAILASLRVQVGALCIYCPVTKNDPLDKELVSLFPKDYDPFDSMVQIETPMILFQGDKDTIILKKWTDKYVEEVKSRNCPIQYHVLVGVGHSIRNEIEKECLQREEAFIYNYFKS